MKRIVSRDSAIYKRAREIRDGRDKSAVFIEGVRLAEEAIRSGLILTDCLIQTDFEAEPRKLKLVEDLKARECNIVEISKSVSMSISDTESTQGIFLIGKRPQAGLSSIEAALASGQSIGVVLFLINVNNPSNLGAVIRTAEAAMASGVIISSGSADVFSPKSLRASMGSAFRLPISYDADIDHVLQWARKKDLEIAAADVGGMVPYTDVDWSRPRLLTFGSEAHGIPNDILGKVQVKMFIPMNPAVESLNLAVSAGILLFEAARQFRERTTGRAEPNSHSKRLP